MGTERTERPSNTPRNNAETLLTTREAAERLGMHSAPCAAPSPAAAVCTVQGVPQLPSLRQVPPEQGWPGAGRHAPFRQCFLPCLRRHFPRLQRSHSLHAGLQWPKCAAVLSGSASLAMPAPNAANRVSTPRRLALALTPTALASLSKVISSIGSPDPSVTQLHKSVCGQCAAYGRAVGIATGPSSFASCPRGHTSLRLRVTCRSRLSSPVPTLSHKVRLSAPHSAD
jgi:hypothetical protein